MKFKYNKIRDYIIIILAFSLVNFLIAINVKMLSINPDEINTLAIPARLAGDRWYLISKLYYGWGGAIFYYPLFLFVKNSIFLYQSIIFLNSIMLTLIPCIVYRILEKYIKIYNRKLRLLLSFFIGVYPGTFSMVQYGWNEIWIRIITWIILFIILKLLFEKRKKRKNNLLLGILMAYSYAIHGRMLSVIPVVVVIAIYIKYAQRIKEKIFSVKYLFLGFFPIFILDNFIKKKLQDKIFNHSGYLVNTFSDTISNKLKIINNPEVILSIFRALSSYIFYVYITSFGIFIVSTLLLRKLLKERDENNIEYVVVGIYSTLGIIFSAIIAALFFAKDFSGTNNFYIYGRYLDNFTPISMLFVFVLIFKRGLSLDIIYTSVAVLLVHSVPFLLIESNEANPLMVDVNITTLISFVPNYIFNSPEKFYLVILLFLILSIYILYLLDKNIYLTLIVGISLYTISNIHLSLKRIEKSEYTFSVLRNDYKILNNIKKIQNEKIFFNFIVDEKISPAIYLMLLKDFNVNYEEDIVKQNIFSKQEKISFVSNNRESIMLDNYVYKIDTKYNKNTGYNLYYSGDEIKKILDKNNVISKKYNFYVVPLDKIFTTEHSEKLSINRGIVKSHTIMYGPYIELRPNKYRIIITGEKLKENNVSFYMTYKENKRKNKVAIGYTVIKKNDNEFIGEFSINSFVQDFETIIENNSETDIAIKSIKIMIK